MIDRRLIPYMLITIVLFTILAVAMTIHNEEMNSDKSYADELSEKGGWISYNHRVYVNSDYYVEKGTEVTQDDLGIWVHTEQDGKPVHLLFRWSEIKAIMIGERA